MHLAGQGQLSRTVTLVILSGCTVTSANSAGDSGTTGKTGIEAGTDTGDDGSTSPSGDDASNIGPGSSPDAASDGGIATSCQTRGLGLTNCGPGGTGTESCCTSLDVQAGSFSRTYASAADGGPTGLADPATLSEFRLDKYDVTVGRFRQFIQAWDGGSGLDGGGGYVPPPGSGKHAHLNGGMGLANADYDAGSPYELGWLASDDVNIAPTDANLSSCAPYSTWTSAPAGNENLPISCVNFYEAYAFCIWDGGFLPSEAEWEYTAAGGNEQRAFPWGSTPPGLDNQYAIWGCNYPTPTTTPCTGPAACGQCNALKNIAPVGTAPLGAGRWGQLDLGSEVSNWILDWWTASGAGSTLPAPYVDPCSDCAFLGDETTRMGRAVVRGGDFDRDTSEMAPAWRNKAGGRGFNAYYGDLVGIRCARVP
jgi:formylglycine-generating enzyme required for sulfatase activity